MHRFNYQRSNLYAEGIKVENIIKQFGTPLYIYSANTILDHFFKLKHAFKVLNPLICFSMKSNSSLAIIRLLVKSGSGIDVVSGGELYKAIKAGCPGVKIVYAGVGKREDEIETAIKAGILFFNVESVPELEKINKIAKRCKKIQSVCIRLNPDVDAKTHKYITTGKKETKFGLPYKVAKSIFKNKSKYKNVKIEGIHLHIGSQIVRLDPFLKAIKVALELKKEVDFEYLNIGGGLGIIYKNEKPLLPDQYAREIEKLLKGSKVKLILEPGRFIVGNAGILVTRVVYFKKGINKNFAITDGGMNLLLRPALYEAYHEINLVKKKNKPKVKMDIVGPVCESSDFLGQDRILPVPKEGEALAVFGAGAYGSAMASVYNGHPLCAEVLVNEKEVYLVKKKENYRDLIQNDLIPDFLR
ncbi:MAG: diaminopimelate decarboxylase [Candidatus Saelkia tenebricola]|nr:diaminopimelate decarboxylase [Candidatus Saelkia tenebricola]